MASLAVGPKLSCLHAGQAAWLGHASDVDHQERGRGLKYSSSFDTLLRAALNMKKSVSNCQC